MLTVNHYMKCLKYFKWTIFFVSAGTQVVKQSLLGTILSVGRVDSSASSGMDLQTLTKLLAFNLTVDFKVLFIISSFRV